MRAGKKSPKGKQEGETGNQKEVFNGEEHAPISTLSGPELVMTVRPEDGLRATSEGKFEAAEGVDVSALNDLLQSEGAEVKTLFGETEENLIDEAASFIPIGRMDVPDLSIYYRVEVPPGKDLGELAKSLAQLEVVASAYVRPPAALPLAAPAEVWRFNAEAPLAPAVPLPGATPDFTDRQNYLEPAPVGIDAEYAWTLPGGTGAGINIIDLEWGWRFTHEDLALYQGKAIAGVASSDPDLENHGTAVIGVLSGDSNKFGITGICPDAMLRAVAFSMSPAAAIRIAANHLLPGDIMLLEIQFPGPNSIVNGVPFQLNDDQEGYIPIEWWPAEFDAIRYAVSRGIIVVEPAGNGAENLDDHIYDTPASGFANTWQNPFDPGNPSSGAIMVGAGNPPVGTHGRNQSPNGEDYIDRARCGFSNYGERVDAQGWGWEVTTAGYGRSYYGGGNRNRWYTDEFCGTSSAAPMVAGALACVQGIMLMKQVNLLSPASAKLVLRATGSPQEDTPGREATQRIGNRPNLRELTDAAESTDVQSLGIEPGQRQAGGPEEAVMVQQMSYQCGQVTEIIIRVGAPEALQTLSGGVPPCVPLCVPCCPPSYVPSAALRADIPLDDGSRALFQHIQKITRDTPEELIRKLAREIGAEELSEEIRRFAKRLGITK